MGRKKFLTEEDKKAYQKEYREKNRDKLLSQQKEWYKKNIDKMINKSKKQYQENKEDLKIYYAKKYIDNKEKICKRNLEYQKNNRKKVSDQVNKRQKERKKIDYCFKLNCRMSTSISDSLKGEKNWKHWEDLVGYTRVDLKEHLEKQFVKGMSWKNYGKKWHIDHRIPKSKFTYATPEDQSFKLCWALTNLQPKFAKENYSKNNRYSEPTIFQFDKTGIIL